LWILSAFLVGFYAVEVFGLTPKLYGTSRILIPTGRYVQMMILYPTIVHLIGDLTTNSEDMKLYSGLTQIKIILMFLSHLVDAIFLKILGSVDFIVSIMVIGKTSVLFNDAKNRMLGKNSTLLLKTIVFASFTAAQLIWIAYFGQVIEFSMSETVCTISDLCLVGGIIITVSFAEIKELEEY
jgi:hypothetical protein